MQNITHQSATVSCQCVVCTSKTQRQGWDNMHSGVDVDQVCGNLELMELFAVKACIYGGMTLSTLQRVNHRCASAAVVLASIAIQRWFRDRLSRKFAHCIRSRSVYHLSQHPSANFIRSVLVREIVSSNLNTVGNFIDIEMESAEMDMLQAQLPLSKTSAMLLGTIKAEEFINMMDERVTCKRVALLVARCVEYTGADHSTTVDPSPPNGDSMGVEGLPAPLIHQLYGSIFVEYKNILTTYELNSMEYTGPRWLVNSVELEARLMAAHKLNFIFAKLQEDLFHVLSKWSTWKLVRAVSVEFLERFTML